MFRLSSSQSFVGPQRNTALEKCSVFVGSSLSRLSSCRGADLPVPRKSYTRSGLSLEHPILQGEGVPDCRSSAPPPPFPKLVFGTPTTWRTEVPLLWSVQLGQSREKFREKKCCLVLPNPRLFSSLSSGQTVNSPLEMSPGWLAIVPKQGLNKISAVHSRAVV